MHKYHTMASLETFLRTGEISPRFDKLLKDIVDDLSPEELKYAVSSIKTNFEKGKFADKGDQDLYSCLHLFANQGLVSEDNLTLLEKFVVTPQTSKKEGIEAKIRGFKAIRLQETEEPTAATRKELTGRHSDLENVMSKLTTGGSSVLNLYGSSGVGKTRLATEVLSQWQGTMKFKVDLREVERMEDVHFQVLQALMIGSKETTTVSYEANPVIFKMRQLRQRGLGDILLLLDNVDQFSGGNSSLNDDFVTFLRRLTTSRAKSSLKILLTSRIAFRHGVDNYEVKGLEKISSGKLLQRQGTPAIHGSQRERLVEMCRGKPLLLNGMAAILRQEIADAERLLGTIEQELVVEPSQDAGDEEAERKETFDAKEEGIDEEQLSCLRKIFFFLPSKTLKESAVSVSLFCRPFSLEAASKILGVNVSEAAIRMEGMRNSQVVSVVPEAKELLYDIHPLMRKFLKSIGNSQAFLEAYQRAKDNFCNHFISRLTTIAALLDKEFVKAFDSYDSDKLNFEHALEISLKSSYLLIPRQHQQSVMICYLLEAMLNDQKQRRKIFGVWAEKVEEDGKEGSMFRAEMRCWEAFQVLNLEGWRKAVEIVQEARELLKRVQRESKKTELFKLKKSSCLFVEGEIFNRAGNWPKALKRLRRSLEIMQDQLNTDHTSTCRCLNAIGNCYSNLRKPEEAIKFYKRAYEMREKLSGSREHFDLPLFRSQIGTAYESMAIQEYQKHRMTPKAKMNFRKAIEYYQEALDLAKELKLTGILNTALYNRNIANAYSWLMEFEKAKPFAYNGYQIRKDILGKHPLTARSTFQMADISRSLEDYDEAEEYYGEAWEIEKSLGQGNHSEVRDRIIKSYEQMLPKGRKRAFQKEVLEFYQRSWDEEKSFEGFPFSQTNMKIIDAINERLGEEADVKTRRKYQSEALWFYEGAWNSPDTKRLPYEQRENVLYSLLRLCKVVKNKELYEKYLKESFRFYERRWKKNGSELKEKQDKIDLLTTLEELAKSLGYERKATKYHTLLQAESKRGASFSLRSLNPFKRTEKSPDNDDDDDDYDSSNDDDDSVDDDFNENDDSGNDDGGDDVADDGGEDDADNDDEDESDNNMDITGDDEITEEHELPQQIHELSLEGQVEDVGETDLENVRIHEGTLTSEGTHWVLKRGDAHIFFPPNAVSEPTPIVVHRWKCSARSPPLKEHESVVSNVLEISTITGDELEFNAEVNLVLSHSAPGLQGYELVIKRLIDWESNEWEEVDGTKDLRRWQDIEDDFPSHYGTSDFFFPIAQADITKCSTYAVVCRLKPSPTYTITSSGGSFSHPDYPGVTIAVPKKAVPPKAKFPVELKVQEVPSEEFEGQDVFLGPVLRITCPQLVEFLKPVTIQLPVSLRSDQEGTPDPSTCCVRVLSLNSDGENKKWVEITDDLKSPVNFDGTFVTFQVEHFSGYACVFGFYKEDFSVSGTISCLSSLIWNQPMLAVFFAYFEHHDRAHSQVVLHFICCPAHLREETVLELKERNVVLTEGISRKEMIPGRDKAFVFVSGGITPVDVENMDDFYLGFESNLPYSGQLPVRLISDQVLSHVEFRSSPDPTAKNLLSKLSFRFSSVNVDHTVSPANRDSRNSNDTSLFTELSLVAEVIDGPNDDFDANEDSNNSDGSEDGGGENGSDDSCVGIGEGNEITTFITEEHELPQEIQEMSLAEEVLDGSSDDLSVNDDSHIGDGDKDGDEDVGDGGNEHENYNNMGMSKGEEIKTCITEERELPQEILELSLAETVKGLAEPASHEMKMHAGISNSYIPVAFLAYFDPEIVDVLRVICCPAHLTEQIRENLEVRGIMPREGNSKRDMIPGKDKAFVVLSGGIRPFSEEEVENFYLRLLENHPFKAELQVRLIDPQFPAGVEFRTTMEPAGRNCSLCKLYLRMPTQKIDSLSTEEANDGASRSLSARRSLRVTTVGDEWSSSKGGLSTVNRELAKHLASQPEVEVTILLPNYTEEEKQEAAESNVRLATPQAMPGIDPIMRLCFPSEELDIDVVIGHGNKLGVPAHVIAKQRKCKWVHIVHTASEELAMFKKSENAITEGEEKHRIEIDLCKEADIVAAIGPKVTDAISACLRRDNKHVMNITPGIFREFSELKQSIDERTKLQKFCILVFGRGDTEDFELKGYDIAAKAVAGLKDKSYKLIFVGAPKGKGEEIKDKLLECGISPSQLIVRGFIKNRDSLGRLFCEADLAIMPSRTEGFGLTALEALSAGLPILVGGNSGFGQALQTLRSTFVVDSDDPDDWREAIECVSGTPRETRQEQARCLLKSYDEKYQWVKQCEMFVQNLREIRK